MEHEYQRAVTRVCVQTALLLLQHGAESTVVVQMAQRLGVALGVESVECALTANAVVLTTLSDNHCITTARKNTDKGINMQMVTDVQRIVIAVEHHLYELEIAQRKLDQLKPLKYNRWLVVFMIGLSCAAFAHLSGGDWIICGITGLIVLSTKTCGVTLKTVQQKSRHLSAFYYSCDFFLRYS